MANTSTLEIEIRYALRMISAGFATEADAARLCGVPLATLQARIETNPLSKNGSTAVRDMWEHV